MEGPMGDEKVRAIAGSYPVPHFESTAFTLPPALEHARVAIVTTAGLHRPEQPLWERGEQSFRVLEGDPRELSLGHSSPNFDRTGFLADYNVVFPIDRLREMANEGVIGSVASHHLSFVGNLDETLTTIRLDTGPAAAGLLLRDGVQVVLLTPV